MNTYLAGTAVTRFRAVKRGADENTVVPATANAVTLGIAMDNQDRAGGALLVADKPGDGVLGEAGAAFLSGAPLMSDGSGRLVTAAGGFNVVAYATVAASSAGDLVEVEIAPYGSVG